MYPIKLLIMDVDGTLTDGKIYISDTGEAMKAFSVKDGLGISKLYRNNIIPVIITGRSSEIVSIRAQELQISEVYQGVKEKTAVVNQLIEKYDCSYDHVAYIGDDENDIACMKLCHISACPADAVPAVKNMCHFVSVYHGGDGAVRDFIEYLLHSNADFMHAGLSYEN